MGEHWKDDLSGLDIFNDETHREIRKYFTMQRGRLKVRYDDMEVRREEHSLEGASASRNEGLHIKCEEMLIAFGVLVSNETVAVASNTQPLLRVTIIAAICAIVRTHASSTVTVRRTSSIGEPLSFGYELLMS